MSSRIPTWDIADDAVPYPEIDTSHHQILTKIGRKECGKSVKAGAIMRQWSDDTDRLVLDINADMDLSDCDPVRLPPEPPYELPPRRRREVPDTYWWQPDPRRGTLHDDIDRMIGLALFPRERKMLLLNDEAGVIYEVNHVGPNGMTSLHQSRHYKISSINCMPRAMSVKPLLLSQSDRLEMYDIPNPDDVKRIADFAGIPFEILLRELHETRRRGDFWSLEFIAQPRDIRGLYRLPPLPLSV